MLWDAWIWFTDSASRSCFCNQSGNALVTDGLISCWQAVLHDVDIWRRIKTLLWACEDISGCLTTCVSYYCLYRRWWLANELCSFVMTVWRLCFTCTNDDVKHEVLAQLQVFTNCELIDCCQPLHQHQTPHWLVSKYCHKRKNNHYWTSFVTGLYCSLQWHKQQN